MVLRLIGRASRNFLLLSRRTLLHGDYVRMASTYVDLPQGGRMPILGFGTWQTNDEELERAVELALEAGYRHIDTAYVYENEHVIGRVLERWLQSGRVSRTDLFIVTKLPPGGNRPQTVEKYLCKSLRNLRLDYVDQYLVHTPFAFVEDENDNHPRDAAGELRVEHTTDHVAVWREMERQLRAGRARSIGVSNFNERQLRRLLEKAEVPPATNQVELHLYFQQRELVEFCHAHNVSVTAYSPLGSRGLNAFFQRIGHGAHVPDLMDNPTVKAVAAKHGRTAAQVLLRHTVQRGIAAIPKSTNADRLRQNLAVFDFALDVDDVARLDAEDKGSVARICDFAFLKGVEKHPEFPF